MILNIVAKKMKIVHSNILILLENLWKWKNHLSLRMILIHTVHPFMNLSISWKVVFIQDKRIIRRHFHNLAMNSYLHPKKNPDNLLYYVSIETEGTLRLWSKKYHVKWFYVWWNHHEYNKEKKLAIYYGENDCLFIQIENTIIYMQRVSLQDFYWEKGTYVFPLELMTRRNHFWPTTHLGSWICTILFFDKNDGSLWITVNIISELWSVSKILLNKS